MEVRLRIQRTDSIIEDINECGLIHIETCNSEIIAIQEVWRLETYNDGEALMQRDRLSRRKTNIIDPSPCE